MTRNAGTFVYTGSGKKQSSNADPAQIACRKSACAIQWCLAKHNHQQELCQDYIKAWKDCVNLVNTLEAQKLTAKTDYHAEIPPK